VVLKATSIPDDSGSSRADYGPACSVHEMQYLIPHMKYVSIISVCKQDSMLLPLCEL